MLIEIQRNYNFYIKSNIIRISNNLGDLVSLLAKTTRKKNIRVQEIRSTSSFYVKERKQKYQKTVSDQIRKRKREKNKYLKLFLKSLL